MTKHEALTKTHDMWLWLSKHPDKDEHDYFYEVLGYSTFADSDKIPINECYACAFAVEKYNQNGACINTNDPDYREDIDNLIGDEDISERCVYCPMPCFGWDENGDKILICDGTYPYYLQPSLYEIWQSHDKFRKFKHSKTERIEVAKEIAKIAEKAAKAL